MKRTHRQHRSRSPVGACRSTFVMGRPFANSSTSVSRMRIFCISGSSTVSTRTPQTTPVTSVASGFSVAAAKKSAKVVRAARWCASCASSKPVSQRHTSSSSAFVRPFRSILVT